MNRLKLNFLPQSILHIERERAIILALVCIGGYILTSIWFGQILWLYIISFCIGGFFIIKISTCWPCYHHDPNHVAGTSLYTPATHTRTYCTENCIHLILSYF